MLVDGNGFLPRNASSRSSPSQQTAQALLAQHRGAHGYDMQGLADAVRGLGLSTSERGALIEEIDARLSPVERGQFAARLAGSIQSVNGQAYAIGDPAAPAIADWGRQPEGSPYRQSWDGAAASLGTSDPATITAEIERQLYKTAAPAPAAGPDPVQLGLDLGQMALDLTGIVDPTPVSDGTNAVVSVGRSIGAVFSGDWSGAGGHLLNAGISAVAIVPGLGDLAKAGKIGKWAQTVADGVAAIAHNPALRASIEPALRTIHDAVGKIPQGARDALPSAARESIERMERQLDAFFAPAARSTEVPAAPYRGTVGGKTVELPHVDAVPVTYTKRDRTEYAALRSAFDNGARATFARGLVSTPEGVAAARRAGLDEAAIARLADGKIPQGWQVHHKLPLDDGGTNAAENLVLIRNSPYHTALTNAQRELVGDLPVGGSRQVDFPVPRGTIYPSGK
ncbi:hypothetical protein [uncultured Sphingomonas sp.]|uniref:hypothetical protein n=1 Tax=uncultured Sphingomonas sp. TaxID=158754 RepID=UPI0025E26854|nr:hypothetical protein [uncultured Sphingomonas sp.]